MSNNANVGKVFNLTSRMGAPGKSPYEIAVEEGYTGTEAEFYAALVSLKDGPFLPLSGGTVTGQVLIKGKNGAASVYLSNSGLRISGLDDKGVDISTDYFDTGNGYVDGKPLLTVFGSEGDEAVILRNIETPVGEVDAANKRYVDAQKPALRTVTLSTSGWATATKKQTVLVAGVLADETKQVIHITHADKASSVVWTDADIWCEAQGADTLTFSCGTVPTKSVNLIIEIEEVRAE